MKIIINYSIPISQMNWKVHQKTYFFKWIMIYNRVNSVIMTNLNIRTSKQEIENDHLEIDEKGS